MRLDAIRPEDIEKKSFEIITELLGDMVLDPINEPVIMRCIHTSADLEYARGLCFSDNAVLLLKKALREGCRLVTDTRMAWAGINKRQAANWNVEVLCFMDDEDVAAEARARGVTRAAVCMEKAMRLEGPILFAVGNAPTALLALSEAMEGRGYRPAGIIGVPVGFVNVVESKELIMGGPAPYIVSRGRKGGSNIAAAICNALLKQ